MSLTRQTGQKKLIATIHLRISDVTMAEHNLSSVIEYLALVELATEIHSFCSDKQFEKRRHDWKQSSGRFTVDEKVVARLGSYFKVQKSFWEEKSDWVMEALDSWIKSGKEPEWMPVTMALRPDPSLPDEIAYKKSYLISLAAFHAVRELAKQI